MSGILPNGADGAVVPSAATHAYVPANTPINTPLKYFSTTCGMRLRSEILNSLSSEILCVVDKSGRQYDANNLCNLFGAITDMINEAVSDALVAQASCQAGAPVSPALNAFWLDGSEVLRKWNGTAWVVVPASTGPRFIACKNCVTGTAYVNCGTAYLAL